MMSRPINRRRMKRLVRRWLEAAGVKRRTAYIRNALHRVAEANIRREGILR